MKTIDSAPQKIEKIYSYDDAYNNSLEYFNGSELPAKVFVDKYALRDNDQNILEDVPEKMHRRLAKELARIEKAKFKNPYTEDQIFEKLDRFQKIVLQGSPMYGIGNPYQYISIGNCFVIPSPLDSYLGIMYTDTQITQISCRRGGVGWDLSNLRPENSTVKNAARTTSGMAEFAKRYSRTIREVGQHGRRGASLQSLSCYHPDIIKFIEIKRDLKELTGSNISVQFKDSFLEAVEKNEDVVLHWPVGSDNPKIKKDYKARDIWKEFVHSAWKMAEPGCMFIDTVHKMSNGVPYGHIEISSNPCQPKNANILTPDGIKMLQDIKIGDLIWSESGWTRVINKFSTGQKKVYRYQTTVGYFLGTEDHRMVSNGEKIPAKDCESIDILKGPSPENIDIIHQVVMDGLVVGDGSVHSASNNLVYLCIGQDDSDYLNSDISYLITKHRPGIKPYAYEIRTQIKHNELPPTYERSIPDRYVYGGFNVVCSFLKGLYSANGSVVDNRVVLKTSSFTIVNQVQLMLSSIGIGSYFTTNTAKKVLFNNGEYLCKESYDINITADREIFYQNIGFVQDYKNVKLRDSLKTVGKTKKSSYDIIETEFVGIEEVFDITVDNNSHTYWTSGINVSNCGEQYLPAFASCRLLLENLYNYVRNKFTTKAYFDFDEFEEDAKFIQRLGDDIVDLEIECIDKILAKIHADPEPDTVKRIAIDLWENVKRVALEDRRTGCGLTGLADCLAALGIKYDSDQGIEMAERIQKSYCLSAYRSSVDMAKEIGPFPLFDPKKDLKSGFIQRLKDADPELFKDMQKYGRRNMILLTISPAGTVSCETETSSGMEPVFLLEYDRKKKGNPGDNGFRTDFVDKNGDHWMTFKMYHKPFADWMKASGKSDVKDSPYYKATANDIDWMQRVKMQAALQKWIDNSISTTINLPSNTSEDVVSNIYLTAWKMGCKGMTIYRDGCRDGVLTSKSDIKTKNKRPLIVNCDIHHVKVSKRLDKVRTFDYLVVVGLHDEKPYEVFAKENGDLDKQHTNGQIIKRGDGTYDLISEDVTLVRNLTKDTTDNEDAITRLTSALLRSGVELQTIVDQLEKVEGADLGVFSRAILRTLKKYIKDGTKAFNKCKCGGEVIYTNGCKMCASCGDSTCS